MKKEFFIKITEITDKNDINRNKVKMLKHSPYLDKLLKGIKPAERSFVHALTTMWVRSENGGIVLKITPETYKTLRIRTTAARLLHAAFQLIQLPLPPSYHAPKFGFSPETIRAAIRYNSAIDFWKPKPSSRLDFLSPSKITAVSDKRIFAKSPRAELLFNEYLKTQAALKNIAKGPVASKSLKKIAAEMTAFDKDVFTLKFNSKFIFERVILDALALFHKFTKDVALLHLIVIY